VNEDSVLYMNATLQFSVSGYETIKQPLLKLYPFPLCGEDDRGGPDNDDEKGGCPRDGTYQFQDDYKFPSLPNSFVSWAASGYSGQVVVDMYLQSTGQQQLAGHCIMNIQTRLSQTYQANQGKALKSVPTGRIALLVALSLLAALMVCQLLFVWRRRNHRRAAKEVLLLDDDEDGKRSPSYFVNPFEAWKNGRKAAPRVNLTGPKSIQAVYDDGKLVFTSPESRQIKASRKKRGRRRSIRVNRISEWSTRVKTDREQSTRARTRSHGLFSKIATMFNCGASSEILKMTNPPGEGPPIENPGDTPVIQNVGDSPAIEKEPKDPPEQRQATKQQNESVDIESKGAKETADGAPLDFDDSDAC